MKLSSFENEVFFQYEKKFQRKIVLSKILSDFDLNFLLNYIFERKYATRLPPKSLGKSFANILYSSKQIFCKSKKMFWPKILLISTVLIT